MWAFKTHAANGATVNLVDSKIFAYIALGRRYIIFTMEEHLIHSLRNSSQRAFQTLYERYHHRLYGYSLRFIKSPALAEEVVHDVFLRVWERRASLRTDTSFESYLFTIAKHRVLDLLRRASKEAEVAQEIARNLPVSRCQPEEDVIYQDYLRYAQQAIAHLPSQRRQVYEFCRLEGKSYEEAARLFSISKGTVKDHIVKAKRSIRQYLLTHANITISLLLSLAGLMLY